MNIQEIRQKYPQYSDLTDEQLGKALHGKYYADMPYEQFAAKAGLVKTGAVEDVAKTLAPSAIRGFANLAGAPADLLELITSGLGSGVAYAAEKLGVDPKRAAEFKSIAKPELEQLGVQPTSKRIREGVERASGELYKPQTRAGKFVGGTVEAGASGLPFGKPQTLLGLLSGAGSETAGLLTNDNPWAKGIAGVAAPLGVQAAMAYRSIPGNMIREATGDITPKQFEDAKRMMARAKAEGIDLMAPEVLPPSSIQPLASDVIASKEGGRVMNQFLANRPDQVKQAVNRGLLDRVGAANTPDVNMAKARAAATDVIEGAEKARSLAVRPDYRAARRDVMPPENIQAIVSQIDEALPYMSPESQAAAMAFRKSIEGTKTNAAAFDDLYKVTRDKIELPAIGATSADKTAAAALRPFNQTLDDSLRLSSDNIQRGREKYRQITQEVIEPLTAGPVGRVAGKHGADPAVPESLQPVSVIANEKIARPESIRELYTHLNKQDPEAFRGIARTWLENAFDQAAQKVQAGENRMVGANFTKAVFGTPQQEANFLETMRGVAKAQGKDPEAVARGARNLMEILQSTGKVAGVGSPTGGRIASNEMARSSKSAAALESVSAAPLRPMANKLREWAMGSNYRKLAEILTDPNAIDKIIQIGKYKPTTTTGMALTIGLLEANAEAGSAR